MNAVTKEKMTKKKKASVEFGADNIDNTAPVKKILEGLQHANDQAYAFYCHTIRPTKAMKFFLTYHYTLTGHPLYAFADDWEGDLNSGYFEPFPFKSLMSKIITPMQNVDKTDPVTDYLKIKTDWLAEGNVFRKISVRTNLKDKYESLNEDVAMCSKQYVDMAAHLEKDPDPYFNDTYNWYYAGNGNMLLICVDWVDYILHSVINVLYLTQLTTKQKNEPCLSTEHASTYDCGEDTNILETIYSTNNVVVLRTKTKIIILKIISTDGNIEFEKIKEIESELPFTSISFDGHHKNILYVTKIDGVVSIVNLDRLTPRTVKLKGKIESLTDNWNTVISSDRVTYTHVTRKSISTYDKRTNQIKYCWKNVRETTDYSTCNDISAAKQNDADSVYFATDHHLFLLDLRYHKEPEPKLIQRWTHGMQCMPTYLSIWNFEHNKELICVGSQWCEDTCVVSNYNSSSRGHDEIASVTMPYRIPSILSTLNAARDKLLCHDLFNPIDHRLSTSVTGHVVLERDENYIVLVQNALGDISCATLYPEHMATFLEDDSVNSLHEWSKSFKLKKKQLEMSSIADITGILKELKRVPETYRICDSHKGQSNIKFDDKETSQIIEDLDSGLLEAWKNTPNETTLGESSLLNLYYSDDE